MKKTAAAALAGLLALGACSTDDENGETSGETNEAEQQETTADENNDQQSEAANEALENENDSDTEEDNNSSPDDNSSEENERAGTTEQEEQEEGNRDASSDENQKSEEDETSDEGEQETENEIAEDEVAGIVFDYIDEHEEFDTGDVQVGVDERDEETYRAQVFTFGPEDAEQQMTQTLGWYSIDKMSGEVTNETPGADEETEEREETESEENGDTSEIVSMGEGERESHHRNLAANEQHTMDSVYDRLLLPGIHENTASYGGRVSAEDSIRFEFPNAENETVDSTVGEDGYFRVDMTPYNFSEEETIIVRITGEYPQEQVFELPVYSEEEGKEFIRVR